MDIIEATADRIVRPVDGRDCTFALLTAYDRAELLKRELESRRAAHKARREEFVENLKLSGLTGEQMFAELEAFAEREPAEVTEQDWISMVNNPLHEVEILTASLRHTHGTEAEALARRARLSLSDKAAICGLQIVRQPDAAAEGGGDAGNPPTPAAVYGTPA